MSAKSSTSKFNQIHKSIPKSITNKPQITLMQQLRSITNAFHNTNQSNQAPKLPQSSKPIIQTRTNKKQNKQSTNRTPKPGKTQKIIIEQLTTQTSTPKSHPPKSINNHKQPTRQPTTQNNKITNN